MKIIIAILLALSCSFSFVPIPQDSANHAFVSAALTKLVRANTDATNTFWIMTGLFVGKELYDCIKPNATGFSLNDLVYDYAGFDLIMLDLKF